ncbi:diaminopimelate decarboxylase family protein [Pseudobutyrivibrio sp. MD2005]|uniref:diaminopimelate decarboxylase family protein n=1 Tax=Pseudobutyrivibrio sp. MD2005 TaxID=1410616 RepID=UPI000485BE31|nr:hypothetical protein [Pseudobutyrivibrio sp. MD2005]
MIDVEKLNSINKGIKTPSYVFDRSEFLNRAKETRGYLGEKIGICFSVKANPFLINPFFRAENAFDKFEVCSLGELHICIKNKLPVNKILYSGVNKRLEEVEFAYDSGVRLFTIESFNHLKYIEEIGKKNNDIIKVLLRISADTQFGMDEVDVIQIIKDRNSYSSIDIVGIHYFTGTQKRGYSVINREIEYLKGFCFKIHNEYGFEIRNVEYGTGLGVEYFRDQKSGAVALEEILPALLSLAEVTNLTIEMGRYFAANCGYYFTKVVDSKQNNGVNYAIVDGGMNHLHYDGQIRSMKIPFHTHIHINNKVNSEVKTEKWTICGSICSTEDVICRDVEYTNLLEGDILVFENSGAYSFMEAMSTFLSREMPQIWAYSFDDGLRLLRDFIFTEVFNCCEKIE